MPLDHGFEPAAFETESVGIVGGVPWQTRKGQPAARFALPWFLIMVLSALSSASAFAETALAGVWQPGSGAQWWRSGMTLQELKDQDKTYFDKGLRLTDVEVADGKHLAVWQPGSGAQWWRARMTYQELMDQDKTYFKQGLR